MFQDYSTNDTYLLACSFGPDSMALFDMLYKKGINFVACLVNYNTRKESLIEEQSLKKYALERNIKCYVKSVFYKEEDGNFEAWARNVRYLFFKEVYEKEHAKGVFVAHHQDDLLETYIMQKKRKMIIPYYGIEKETTLFNMTILRPLLSYSKKDLLAYCQTNNIPYSIDVTNNEDKHTRNKIRHQIINNLSLEERNNLLKEIDTLNSKRKDELKNIKECFESERIINIDRLKKFSVNEQIFALYKLIIDNAKLYTLTRTRAKELLKVINSSKPNIKVCLKDNIYFIKEYDKAIVKEENPFEGYELKIEKPKKVISPFFELDLTSDTSNRNITIDDYPLTIRTFKPNDYITIKNVKREVRRLFIDLKMPLDIRKFWPIIVNKDNKIIYIPRYQGDFKFDPDSNLKIFTN